MRACPRVGSSHILCSKEQLQVAALQHSQERFQAAVIMPALRQAHGLPRIEALLHNWFYWMEHSDMPGGCVMLGAVEEYDDRPCPVRDTVASSLRELRGVIAKAVRMAIEEQHLRADTDPWQFAFEFLGIVIAAASEWRRSPSPRLNSITTPIGVVHWTASQPRS